MPVREDEQLVASFRTALAALVPVDVEGTVAVQVQALLDGAQLAARSEVLLGRSDRLPELVPGYVYLLVCAVADEPSALRVAKRASLLLAG